MKRIVSLLPSATELCCSLGLRDQLVAVSHECDYPSDLPDLPRITSSIIPHGLSQGEIDTLVREALAAGTSLYSVDETLLNELKPDLILTQGLCSVCAVSEDTIQATLRGNTCFLPVDTTVISFSGTSFDGICADLRALAQHTDTMARVEEIIAQERRRWQSVSRGEAESLLLLEWIDPFFSAGHWVPEQIEAAGFRSSIGAVGDHSRTLSIEEVVQTNAQAIGVICCGFSLDENVRFAQELYKDQRLSGISAVQNERIWAFDANSYFSRPTLRIRRGAELLHEAFVKGKAHPRQSKRVEREQA